MPDRAESGAVGRNLCRIWVVDQANVRQGTHCLDFPDGMPGDRRVPKTAVSSDMDRIWRAVFGANALTQGAANMIREKQTVCKRCGRQMDIVAEVPSLERGRPGLVAFLCEACGAADSILVYPDNDSEHQSASPRGLKRK